MSCFDRSFYVKFGFGVLRTICKVRVLKCFMSSFFLNLIRFVKHYVCVAKLKSVICSSRARALYSLDALLIETDLSMKIKNCEFYSLLIVWVFSMVYFI